MRVADCCKRGVITVDATADIVDVAKTMRDEHVGFLIVIEDGDPKRKPIGVITDRDNVLQVCAKEGDPHGVTAVDIKSRVAGLLCDISGSIRNEQRQERRRRTG